MPELNARNHIPDSWATSAHCIFCGFNPLSIERVESKSDQIKCTRCGLSIKLDESGQCVQVAQFPNTLKKSISTTWMTLDELTQYLKNEYNVKVLNKPTPFKDFSSSQFSSPQPDKKVSEPPTPVPQIEPDLTLDTIDPRGWR